jgi:hypothetical protein
VHSLDRSATVIGKVWFNEALLMKYGPKAMLVFISRRFFDSHKGDVMTLELNV